MNEFLCALMGNSWKTTLAGIVLAIIQVVVPLAQNGDVTTMQIFWAVVTVIAGRLVKDANVSGADKC
jgi:hypothetical protein